MAITTGQATPNYSQSFSPAYGNPLIAALRANSPAPARQASGIEDISTGVIFNTPERNLRMFLRLTAMAARLVARLAVRGTLVARLAARLAALHLEAKPYLPS
jgi:hypothetical protein